MAQTSSQIKAKYRQSDKGRQTERLWREANREKINAYHKARYAADPEYHNEISRRWRKADPERAKVKYRKDRLSTKYGMSLADWDALFSSQGNKCGMCGSTDPGCSYGWHTDHDHDTGVVRGILCNGCNLLLGHAKDDINRLYLAIEYLSRRMS